MSIFHTIRSVIARTAATFKPVARSHDGQLLRPGMRIRLAIGPVSAIHTVEKIVGDGVIMVRYSDGVSDRSFSNSWVVVAKRRRSARRR